MSLLDYKGYRAIIDYSYTDNVFHGKIFGISDLVSFEGVSIQELEKAFMEAVDDYLETCIELKKDPDKSFKGSFNVRILPETHKRAALLAEMHHVSLNDFVEKAITILVNSEGLYPSNENGTVGCFTDPNIHGSFDYLRAGNLTEWGSSRVNSAELIYGNQSNKYTAKGSEKSIKEKKYFTKKHK